MRNMSRIEAFCILDEMRNNATVEQNEALTIAQYDIEFVDLMPDDMVHVVRCGNCERRNKSADLTDTIYCPWLNLQMRKGDYCSYGERKDGE